jgi:hypothetical protein
MTLPEALGLISGLFLIGGYIPYIWEVLRKTSVPNRASWFIWSLSTAIILFGVKETGTHEAIWVPIADALGCFIIFAFSIKWGVGGWSFTDRISLFICLMSLVVLWLTGNALIALVMNLFIYISGYISTIKKEIDTPGVESKTAWTIFFIGVVLNLVTVMIGTDQGFAVWLYPIVLVVVVGVLCYFIYRGSFLQKRVLKVS